MDCLFCQSVVPGKLIEVDDQNCCIKCGRFIGESPTKHTVENLAKDHWDFIYSTVQAHTGMEENSNEYIICKHHYISAFVHGYKHGKDSK